MKGVAIYMEGGGRPKAGKVRLREGMDWFGRTGTRLRLVIGQRTLSGVL